MTDIIPTIEKYHLGNGCTDIDALLDMLNEQSSDIQNTQRRLDALSDIADKHRERLVELENGRHEDIKWRSRLCGYTALLPERKTEGAAGADLRAVITPEDSDNTIPPTKRVRRGKITTIETGVAVEIPQGHFGILALRSSLGTEGLCIPNGVGIIDSDYRGTIKVTLTKTTRGKYTIHDGDRIAQLIIVPHLITTYRHASELNATHRGTGGFGSTGR